MGFKYLYLSPDDFAAFPSGTVNASEIVDDGETRMKLDDIIGQMLALFVITVAAAESAIGLAILVAYYRVRGTIGVEYVRLMKN